MVKFPDSPLNFPPSFFSPEWIRIFLCVISEIAAVGFVVVEMEQRTVVAVVDVAAEEQKNDSVVVAVEPDAVVDDDASSDHSEQPVADAKFARFSQQNRPAVLAHSESTASGQNYYCYCYCCCHCYCFRLRNH